VLVEQNAKKALVLCDHAYVLENGRITTQGKGKELLADPAMRKAYLGESQESNNRISGTEPSSSECHRAVTSTGS
jgi:branched-chain amino acid transport system ATP-binding protein